MAAHRSGWENRVCKAKQACPITSLMSYVWNEYDIVWKLPKNAGFAAFHAGWMDKMKNVETAESELYLL